MDKTNFELIVTKIVRIKLQYLRIQIPIKKKTKIRFLFVTFSFDLEFHSNWQGESEKSASRHGK